MFNVPCSMFRLQRGASRALAGMVGFGFLMLSAAVARQLPDAQLESLLAGFAPPVVVVPDVRGPGDSDDVATRMRRQLGVLE